MSSGPSYFDWLSQSNGVSEASFLALLRKMFFFRTDLEDEWQITMKIKSLILSQFTTKIHGMNIPYKFRETVSTKSKFKSYHKLS